MKTVKLAQEFIEPLLKGEKVSTWRMFDDKDLSVDETVQIIDKSDPEHPGTWEVVGTAHIDKIIVKQPRDLSAEELRAHNYGSLDEMLTRFKGYYGDRVTDTTPLKIIEFTFSETRAGSGGPL